MDELLETLDKDPDYHCFLLDGQVAPINDYLDVKPRNREKVTKYIKEGRIAVGPWYTLPDLYALDGECLVRNLLKGIRTSEGYGKCMKVGYNSFGWGQTAQFPPDYAEARRLSTPAMTYQVMGGQRGDLALEQGFFAVSDKNLQISALKKAEDRDSIILRVFNPTDAVMETGVSLTVPGVTIGKVVECNLNEEHTGKEIPVTNNSFKVAVGINKIKTYEMIME